MHMFLANGLLVPFSGPFSVPFLMLLNHPPERSRASSNETLTPARQNHQGATSLNSTRHVYHYCNFKFSGLEHVDKIQWESDHNAVTSSEDY